MELQIGEPSPEESDAGAVAHFRHDSDRGWTAAGTVSKGPNGHVISHLEVWPGSSDGAPGDSVTTRMLHGIRVGQIINAARRWDVERAIPAPRIKIRTADEIIGAAPKESQPGRAPLPDELLHQVAEGYLAEAAPGRPRGAVKRLAQQLGRSENTVSRWVAGARKDGWLGPGRQGYEGAEPGPKLLAERITTAET